MDDTTRGALLDTRAFQRTFLRGSCPVYGLRFRRFEAPVWDGEKNSYNGNAYGGGISYGYQLYVSPRWNVEFTAGFGYLHFEYDKYAFPRGDAPIGKFRNEYWGLTKAGISIVYIIK